MSIDKRYFNTMQELNAEFGKDSNYLILNGDYFGYEAVRVIDYYGTEYICYVKLFNKEEK